MFQKEMNQENNEIRDKAYELYQKHGFKDGDDFLDWLEAEKQTGRKRRVDRRRNYRIILFSIIGILCLIVAMLLILLFRRAPQAGLSQQNLADLKVMMLVLDQKEDEAVAAFGDTHFEYGKSTLSLDAKALLDGNIQTLKENPKMKVRLAGYTSARGDEASNQALSEGRAQAVRDYLLQKGIGPERISIIGYGRTKPALYEVSPGRGNTKEAKANMRVLFEVVVN
jgi:outer membrane protein OmpA-like peptidoglycan-associated protein